MKKIKIKTGDNIKVIAGDHKGSEGKVIKIFKANNTALIEDIGNTPSNPVNHEACFCKKYKKIISTGQKISD